ncbi:MAG: hypothetical protein K0S65_5128 [Labilithrix sp.]|nr:hypothetical protein [Labilithrix sp.]
MKIPARLIGMIVAGVAVPLVAGCTAETEPSTPAPVAESQSQLAKEPNDPANNPDPAATTPTASTPDASTTEPEPEPTPEDPCPPCGMG